ncbi:MAG: tRNA pseudouridine(13) synthase TruD [Planctomycetota bacterium]|nr:MAG: tRNA pseudouridine(13) synthase TruD [Planctomycetota bacterium]
MKLKCLPEDFVVEEIAAVEPTGGPFALYRLEKRSLGTPEALQAIRRRWRLPQHAVCHGGLKDRHALTRQYVTIYRGPRRDLRQTNLTLTYLGQTERPFRSADIVSNAFEIVLRALTERQAKDVLNTVDVLATEGVPNYFDDQRFGSVGVGGDFIAKAWCRKDYERALWLALAEPNVHDRAREKRQKQILRECWGDWGECKRRLERSNRRSVVTFLADHPRDFRRALALLPKDLRSLYVAAFQSALWNRLLAAWLRQLCKPEQLVPVSFKLGRHPFPTRLDEGQRERLFTARLPLPSRRLRDVDPQLRPLLETVLAEEGLSLADLRIPYPRDTFFSKGMRRAAVRPEALSAAEDADELYPGRRRITLKFRLPRGAYATIVIKRLTEVGRRP